MALAQNNPELRYANLAVRGRRMDEILTEQVQTAVMLEPDLVTVYAGMNDLLLVRNDIDGKMARYADGLKTLQQTGAHVLVFTAGDLGTVPLFRRLRGRAAVYNELLRSIAEDLGLQLVDFWRFSEFRDPRLWDGDRIHLSPLGHERMAAKVLDSLTVPHELATRSAALLRSTPPVANLAGQPAVDHRLRGAVGGQAGAPRDAGRRHRAEVDDPDEGALTTVRSPRIGGLHLQFGADASTEVVVSWHSASAVRNPRVMVGTPARRAGPDGGRRNGGLPRRRVRLESPGASRAADRAGTRHRLRVRRLPRRSRPRVRHRAHGTTWPGRAAVHQLR